MNKKVVLGAAAALSGVVLTSCSQATIQAEHAPGSSSNPSSDKTTVVVFAAASLNAAGDELEKKYEETHNVDLQINYAGSSTLVRQLADGAPADVLITADAAAMEKARAEVTSLEKDTEVIATNQLVLVTAPGNPRNIQTVKDLQREEVVTGICAADVPCGRLATTALEKAGASVAVRSEETSVSKVATKIANGEVDAGFIYTTDARNIQDATVIDLANVPSNEYPLALTSQGESNNAATDFAQWLNTAEAQSVLEKYGFDKAQ